MPKEKSKLAAECYIRVTCMPLAALNTVYTSKADSEDKAPVHLDSHLRRHLVRNVVMLLVNLGLF